MQPKTRKILFWIITLLFSAFMLLSAVSELSQTPDAQKIMTDLGYPLYVNIIIGVAKIIGVIVLLQWKWHTIKEWAYAGFTIDILGAASSVVFAGFGWASALLTSIFFIPLFLSYWLWKTQ